MNHPGVAGRSPPFPIAAAAAAVILCWAGAAQAAPVGGQVAAGTASIATTGAQTTITQATSSAVINWTGFGIGIGESVQFNQPGSSSVTLNRVIGSDPSAILGNLSANGKVFLVNSHGVFFGKGASVAVGGLVASTLDIRDADFMAGRHTFSGTSRAAVRNEGTLRADGGYVVLIGADVANHGTISARQGSVALAAGEAVTLDLLGDKLLQVQVDRGALNAVVRNGGLIQADGGQVLLTAQGAGSLLSTVVNNTGVIQARTISTEQGVIKLLGDMESGLVSVGGTLDVSGAGAGQTGGSVTATGHHVGLFSARIDASGDAGGGTVLVGGGFQGKDLAVRNAAATYMSADSSISADATARGTGGTVVLWSDDSTRAYGGITARGGPQGGDGGLIETSGHWLDVAGIKVNASASNGNNGTWLLDPTDVRISLDPTSNGDIASGIFTPTAGAATSNVNVAELVGDAANGLTGGTNITINTASSGSGNGDITVDTPITWVRTGPGPASTLTLNATRDTLINSAITTDFGNLVVCCGRDIKVNAAITTRDGSVLLNAGRDIFMASAMTTTRGNITMCSGRDLIVSGKIVLTDFAAVGNPSTSLGLADGLVLSAGNAATGPGAGGGTLTIVPRADPAEITRAPVTIVYNPVSYLAGGQTDYSTGVFFANPGDPHIQFMLVYPDVVDRNFLAGNTAATLQGFKSTAVSGAVPGTVSLVAGPLAAANFNTATAGNNKTVTFSGFSLSQDALVTGGAGVNFALPVGCCAPFEGTTTGNVNQAPIAPLPVVVVPPPVVAVVPVEGWQDSVTPQFVPFAVAPVLLRPLGQLLVVSAEAPETMALVVEEAAAPVSPAPTRATAPAAPPAAAAAPAPAAPYRAAPRPPKPYRN